MAKNLNQPEAPREGLDETRRDLDELRAEVSQWPIDVAFGPVIGSIAATQILESLNWSEETVEEENLDLDEEVKSWMEKIVNKSFEDVISDHKGGFPMWFERLNVIEKLNAISLKAAINKLWDKVKKLPINKIKEEALNQKNNFINKANEKLSKSFKSKNDLKSYWLTDSECNKLVKFLEDSWFIGTSEADDDWEIIYWEDGTIITEKKRGTNPALLPFIGWPILFPMMNLLVRAWIVKKQWKQEKSKEDNDQNPKERDNENKPESWEKWKGSTTGWWNSWWSWEWWSWGGGWSR